jgi:nitroimidazol reductase NimA-like FMN-containing flavoprotein (pyridoxamine 5'-phosphate oxidase superfamily)
MSDSFEITPRNRVVRVASRGRYDRQSVYEVIDAAWIGNVAIRQPDDHGITVIPMLHARQNDSLVFHGAASSRLMKYLGSNQPVTVSFALVDGLVLAKSLFHHSMNYRSAVVYGRGVLLQDEAARRSALKAISDKVLPGRWEDARQPNDREMKATAVVQVVMESASAKIREGDPLDDADDLSLPVWSGVLPLQHRFGQPLPDSSSGSTPLPDYLKSFIDRSS